jgi:hypothetical protein
MDTSLYNGTGLISPVSWITNGQSKTFCNQLFCRTRSSVKDRQSLYFIGSEDSRREGERNLVPHVHRSAGRSSTGVQVERLPLLESIEDVVQVSMGGGKFTVIGLLTQIVTIVAELTGGRKRSPGGASDELGVRSDARTSPRAQR